MTLDVEFKPRRNPDSAFRPVGEDGGLVVLPTRTEVKVLNPVGIRIFGLLDGERTVGQIADALTEEFDVDRDRALADVQGFLAQLADHGMLAGDEPEPTTETRS